MEHKHKMQRNSLPTVPSGRRMAFGRSALLAIILAAATGHAIADDKAEPRNPQNSPVPGDAHQGSSSPSYWAGKYWDAQDGNNFWHRLKPTSKRSPQAKSDGPPSKSAVNGSLRIRNENRARRR